VEHPSSGYRIKFGDLTSQRGPGEEGGGSGHKRELRQENATTGLPATTNRKAGLEWERRRSRGKVVRQRDSKGGRTEEGRGNDTGGTAREKGEELRTERGINRN